MTAALRLSSAALFASLAGSTSASWDYCTVMPVERVANVGAMINSHLDRDSRQDGYPAWMGRVVADPDLHEELLAMFCPTVPEVSLATAMERIYNPSATAK